MIFRRNISEALIEGRICVVISCHQSQFSGCHDDDSNGSLHLSMSGCQKACLEFEHIPGGKF